MPEHGAVPRLRQCLRSGRELRRRHRRLPDRCQGTAQCRASGSACDLAESATASPTPRPMPEHGAVPRLGRRLRSGRAATASPTPARRCQSTAQCRASSGVCDLAESCDASPTPAQPMQEHGAVPPRAVSAIWRAATASPTPARPMPRARRSAAPRAAPAIWPRLRRRHRRLPGRYQEHGAVPRLRRRLRSGQAATASPRRLPGGCQSAACRASGGVCDLAEAATASPTLPGGTKSTASAAPRAVSAIWRELRWRHRRLLDRRQSMAECRAAAGECDVARLQQDRQRLPTDGFEPSGTTCADGGGECSVREPARS
jgi:hypothetical protein